MNATEVPPLQMLHAMCACDELVEDAGYQVLAAKLEGDRRKARKAQECQNYWLELRERWAADLRALAQRVVSA